MLGAVLAENPKDYKVVGKLGSVGITIVGYTAMRTKGVSIITDNSRMNPININQLNSLFGK